MFLVEDETKLVDRYATSTTREVRLLALVEKLHTYIHGQLVDNQCPLQFIRFFAWIKPNQLVVDQLASKYFDQVVIERSKKAIYKDCKDHLQVFKTWGIVLDPKIATNVEHRQKTIWRLETKQNKQSSDSLKRSINERLIGKDIIRNCVDKLGELDVNWFRNCCANTSIGGGGGSSSSSLQNATCRHLTRFTNTTAGRGKSDDQLLLMMLMVRAVVSYDSKTGICSSNFVAFNLAKSTFTADNSMVFEYTNGKTGPVPASSTRSSAPTPTTALSAIMPSTYQRK